MHTNTRDLVSITDFSRRPSAYVTNLKGRERKVILRNNAPIAVLVTADELERLDAAHQDTVDLALTLTRKLADKGNRETAADVFAEFDIDWDDLDEDGEED